MLSLDERALFMRGPVVVFRWRNADGWPVEYVSANAAEVFGYRPDQFLSGEVVYADLIHPDDLERVGAEVVEGSVSAEGSFIHEPYRIVDQRGAVRWLYDVTHVLRPTPEAEPSHFLGYVIDVTEHIEAEQERKVLLRRMLDTQKLESIGILAGGVAHDFNNLLTGILGQTELAQRALPPHLDEVARRLEHIEALTMRAADLTNQLLAYAGKGRLHIELVDLSELASQLVTILETVTSKKAEVTLELGDVPPVLGDRTQLQQVLMNLVTNASDALGDEVGTITIVTGHRRFDADALDAAGAPHLKPGPYVSVRVTDTGCGMSPQTQAHLFDPFFTTKVRGRGLGLSAVQGILRSHRGSIRVDSEPGHGTTFELLFPASVGVSAEPSVPAPADATSRGEGRILVADDEASVRTLIVETLALLGFDSITACNGAEALERFDEAADVRLAILDVRMPVMGGREAALALRERAPGLPILLSSGHDESVGFGSLAQPWAFLRKPYHLAGLEALVHELLSAACPA